jgi:hypothetical protein
MVLRIMVNNKVSVVAPLFGVWGGEGRDGP